VRGSLLRWLSLRTARHFEMYMIGCKLPLLQEVVPCVMDFQFCQPFKDYDDDLYAKYSHKGNNMLKNIDFDTLRLRDYFEAN